MDRNPEPTVEDANDRLQEMLKEVIRGAHARIEKDTISFALLLLLVRQANTWQSIRWLLQMPNQEGVMIDIATLLRAMFDT